MGRLDIIRQRISLLDRRVVKYARALSIEQQKCQTCFNLARNYSSFYKTRYISKGQIKDQEHSKSFWSVA
jgi:hypothetical protein